MNAIFTGPPEAPNIEEAKAAIAKALDGKPPEMQERILTKMIADDTVKLEDVQRRRDELARKRAVIEMHVACMDAVQPFFVEGPLELEPNTCSRLHNLKDGTIYGVENDEPVPFEDTAALRYVEHTFVVKHDWARAFEDASGLEDGIHLPYDICAFEFRIRGKSIIAVAGEHPDGGVKFASFIHAMGDYWYSIGTDDKKEEPIIRFIWNQIRAISIALDAEVATHEVVRASTALNEKRRRAGKTLLADFHVIDLSRRHRIANPVAGGDSGRKVRLHFRRGHWRHYDDHKTWIKWMLVGNPDLGFIRKHYAL